MRKTIKFLFLSLVIGLLSFFGISLKADGVLSDKVSILLEQQESLTQDKIRYVSTLTLDDGITLDDITSIDVSISLKKANEETKNTSTTLTKVYDSITGANGKEKKDNTYYAVLTITDLAANYPLWTLETTFEYVFSDFTTKETNTISYVIPMPQGYTHVAEKDPTCNETGNYEYYYDEANDTYYDKNGVVTSLADLTIPKTGLHTWVQSGLTNPTRIADGSVTYTCSICNEEKTLTIDKLGLTRIYFTNSNYWSTVYAYIFNSGDDTYNTWPGTAMTWLKNNDYGQGIYYIDFNISSYNYIIFTDGTSQTVNITVDKTTTNAYYPSDANQEGKYTVGEWSLFDIPDSSLDNHNWNSGVITKEPSCTEVGYKTYTCTDLGCDETKVELLAPLGHTWNSGEVTKEPTESTKGIKTFTCSVCGETKTEDIPVLAHTHQEGTPIYTWSNDHLSCSATLPCSICGEALAYESVKATYEDTVIATCLVNGTRIFTTNSFLNNHFTIQTYNMSTTGNHVITVTDSITSPATCTESGISLHEVSCSVCSQVFDSEEMTIDPIGHDYDTVVTPPTRTTAGSITYTCQNCSNEKQTIIPALGTNGVYFTNNKNWDQVYIYPFTATDNPLHQWPGVAMTYVGLNGDGQGIYYYAFDITTYTKVVFNNNNGLQSVDVTLDLTTTNAYYLSSDESKYTVGTWTYYSIPNGLCTEHEWDDGVITTPATTTSTGVLTYTCTVCGETYTEIIPKLGHTHTFEDEYSYSTKYHFHNCLDSDCDLVSDKEEHDFLLAYDDGTYYNICQICGYIDEITVAGIKLHYYRPDGDYSVLNSFYIWGDYLGGNTYTATESDSFGRVYTMPYSVFAGNSSFIVIIKCAEGWSSQDGLKKYFDLSDLTIDSNNYYNVYFVGGKNETYTAIPEATASGEISYFKIYYDSGYYYLKYGLTSSAINWSITVNGNPLVSSGTADSDSNTKGYGPTYLIYKLGSTIPNLSDIYTLNVTYSGRKGKAIASMWDLYDLTAFNQTYGYDGTLGAIYSKNETVFKVWSPVATEMKLRIYETGTPKSLGGSDSYTEYQMTGGTKASKGVWSYTLNGDQEGKYYTYVVTNYMFKDTEVVDPYAKSTGVNGLRGMVVDFSKVNPEGWDDISILNTNSMDLVVYEAHIADLTSSETWGGPQNLAKTYLGFCYSGTTYTEGNVKVSTGFDHIKELGVNAVQLLPIFDSSNDEINPSFNWGYNPLNYNSLDGSYSTNPYDGYEKIREFKQLVYEYNKAGITIIMDVVFNHVADSDLSNFHRLVPGYYFRHNDDYYFMNGSGCGNETASDRLMYQKFMIDSTEFWAREYKLGGFRFDLMGIHDIETMEALADNLKDNVQSNIVVYGEPWAAAGIDYSTKELCTLGNYYKWDDFGSFNSTIRDAMFGSVGQSGSRGWGSAEGTDSQDLYKIMNGVMGYMQDDRLNPVENTVAYISCHDNFNVYDHLKTCGFSDEGAALASTMGHAIILTSQGISFIQEGEEILRTKDGEENSYDKPYDVNDIDYSNKVKYLSMFNNFKKLIALKTSGDITIPLDQISNVRNTIVYDDTNFSYFYYEVGDYVIYHHNGTGEWAYLDTTKYSNYSVYLDTFGENTSVGNQLILKQYQTVILKKNN